MPMHRRLPKRGFKSQMKRADASGASFAVIIGDDEIAANRDGTSIDDKADAAVRFAAKVVHARGHVSDADVQAVKSAGYSDAEVMEIVVHVALNTLSVDINFAIRATRGQAAGGADPALDYFVAIVDVDNNVLVKKTFQSRPNLGGRMTGTFQETIASFAVPLEMDKRPVDYEILTGFQLTPDELALNRAPKPLPQVRR